MCHSLWSYQICLTSTRVCITSCLQFCIFENFLLSTIALVLDVAGTVDEAMKRLSTRSFTTCALPYLFESIQWASEAASFMPEQKMKTCLDWRELGDKLPFSLNETIMMQTANRVVFVLEYVDRCLEFLPDVHDLYFSSTTGWWAVYR